MPGIRDASSTLTQPQSAAPGFLPQQTGFPGPLCGIPGLEEVMSASREFLAQQMNANVPEDHLESGTPARSAGDPMPPPPLLFPDDPPAGTDPDSAAVPNEPKEPKCKGQPAKRERKPRAAKSKAGGNANDQGEPTGGRGAGKKGQGGKKGTGAGGKKRNGGNQDEAGAEDEGK